MISTEWRLDNAGSTEQPTGGRQLLVSFHFLRSVLRRRWPVWAAAGLVGLVLGAALPVLMPAPSNATATLLLSHQSDMDPNQAMATDVSMVNTRTVAERVIQRLHLEMSADEFQQTVTAEPTTTSILNLTVAAPDPRAALVRARTLTSAFLDFRTRQFQEQARAQIDGFQTRIASLQKQVSSLSRQYDILSRKGVPGRDQASQVLNRKAQLGSQISSLQQQIEDVNLQTGAVLGASHVLDPATVVPQGKLRRLVLDTASGLIGGLALGIGFVIFRALTSDRLRRREDVAVALGVPVRLSAGPLTSSRLRRGRDRSAQRSREIVVRALVNEFVGPGTRPARIALGAVDTVTEAALVGVAAAAQLQARGLDVLLVDLTDEGEVQELAAASDQKNTNDEAGSPVQVLRPESVPTLAHGPMGPRALTTVELSDGGSHRAEWERADAVLVVAELDPSLGVEHLSSWADRAVLLAAAGRSGAERVRTIGDLINDASLETTFAMLVGTDGGDESTGILNEVEVPRELPRRAQL